MSFGMAVYKADGSLAWDSTQVEGGVILDAREFDEGDSTTLTYPAAAGRSVDVVTMTESPPPSDNGIAADTSLGYPRVTVTPSSGSGRRTMLLLAW